MTTTTNRRRLFSRALVITAALFTLSACALAPGSHQATDVEAENVPEGLEGEVKLYHVTPSLVADLQQPRRSPEANTRLAEERENYQYRVGKGDILMITVWNHPELTIPAGSMRNPEDAGNPVHDDGTIFYPYIGRIEVEGLRVTEIRERIRSRISDYIEDPQLDVQVAAFNSKRIHVTGEVQQPGIQPITNVPLTLLDAVNAAGGITEYADWRSVVVTRDGQEQRYSLQDLYQRGDTTQNMLLQHGDVVHVERNDANKVFVLGEVRSPSSVMLQRHNMTLAEALTEAGGVHEERADTRGIFVFRPAPEEAEHVVDVFQLNVREATSYILADQFEMEPRDIVYVTAAPVTRWNRVISMLMPTVSGIYQITRTETELSR